MVSPPVTASDQPSLAVAQPVVEKPTSVTLRATVLSLSLAFFFGYVIPIVDMKMRNTFLGATHLPPGAIAVLLVLLLGINPLLTMMARQPAKTVLVLGALGASAAISAYFYFAHGIDSLTFWVFGALAALFALVLILGVARKPLSRNEILTVYISCLFSCLAPGHGAENVFVVNLIGPFYYATRENNWLAFMEPYMRPWMTPALNNPSGTYGGNDVAHDILSRAFLGQAGGAIPWGAWLVPLLVWGTAIAVMYVMMACLCVIMRKQWAEREALAFPLLKLPLELTESVDQPQDGMIGRFFRNPMMWIGFGLAVFIQTLRGLNYYFPDVPLFPLSLDTTPLLTEAPWNQIGGFTMVIYPLFVGIAYLLTSEVSFSVWFFYWFIKFQLIAAYLTGFTPATLPTAVGGMGGPWKSFTLYQQIGCYLGYVAIVLWTGREHLRHIALRGFGLRRAREGEAEEPLSYPLAFWGFVLSFGLLIGWSIAAGMNPTLALVMWGLYLVTIIALTRIISEAGLLFVQQGWVPLGILGEITNAGKGHWLLNDSSLPPAAMMQGALMTDLRGLVMPSFIQGFKLAHDRKIALKPLLGIMVACTLISFVVGTYMNVKLSYSTGLLQLDAWYAGPASTQPASVSASLIKGVTNASWFNLAWVAVGIVLTYGMMLARSRFAWFPLHPIGFLVSQSYPIGQLWFSVFLGWSCKVLIQRFGGSETYRKTTPLFLGLALGDVTMMLFWLVIDGWQGRVGHKFMPG